MDEMVAFIRARLDEREADAELAASVIPDGEGWYRVAQAALAADEFAEPYGRAYRHIAANDPARVLRDVRATRRIVDEYVEAERKHEENLDKFGRLVRAPAMSYDAGEVARVKTHGWELDGCRAALKFAVKLVASRWDDHPEFRDEWRTE